ncbi:hypothetical protein JCM8097_000557 [Rhodosporidiobolus ruineniae]
MRTPSPAPSDDDDAQQRLAQLEALLGQDLLFDLAPQPPAPTAQPPKKRKKTQHTAEETASEAAVKPEAVQPEPEVEQVAFRLFSTQKAPQTVVLREAKSPEPFVLDRRIRDVDDEPEEVVKARRAAIEQLAVDGQTLLASSRLPSLHAAPHARLLTSRRLSLPPAQTASHPLPILAYLNAVLPLPLHKLSPATVPDEDHPPERPNDGLIATAPVELVEGRKGQGKGKDPRPRLPKRSKVIAFVEQHQQGRALKLRVLPILEAEKVGGVIKVEEAVGTKGRGGKRVSKERRERARRRAEKLGLTGRAAAGAMPVAAVAAQ